MVREWNLVESDERYLFPFSSLKKGRWDWDRKGFDPLRVWNLTFLEGEECDSAGGKSDMPWKGSSSGPSTLTYRRFFSSNFIFPTTFPCSEFELAFVLEFRLLFEFEDTTLSLLFEEEDGSRT